MRQRHAVIRQIYVSGAMLAFAASFVQLWEPEPEDVDSTYATMNLWSAVAADQGGAAAMGVLLILVLIGTAVTGGARTAYGRGVPLTVLAIGAIALLLLLTKPEAGDPPPDFGPGASLMFGTTLLLMVTALVDAVVPPPPARPAESS